MLRSHEESIHLLCPMLTVWDPAAGQTQFASCHGHNCAAWRRHGPGPDRRVVPGPFAGKDEPPRPPNVPPTWIWLQDEDTRRWAWFEDNDSMIARWRGYCGLAPLPQRIKVEGV